jgi:hypothetical protein
MVGSAFLRWRRYAIVERLEVLITTNSRKSHASSVSLTLLHIRSIERGAMTARPFKGTGLSRLTPNEYLSRCRTISDWLQQ